jgi:hypothetical protein
VGKGGLAHNTDEISPQPHHFNSDTTKVVRMPSYKSISFFHPSNIMMNLTAIRTWSEGVLEPLSPLALEHSKDSRHKQHNKELMQTINQCIDKMQQQAVQPHLSAMDEPKTQEHGLNLDEVVENTGMNSLLRIQWALNHHRPSKYLQHQYQDLVDQVSTWLSPTMRWARDRSARDGWTLAEAFCQRMACTGIARCLSAFCVHGLLSTR